MGARPQLAYRISVDVPSLKAQGYTVHRPAVFFLTDGLPNGNEDWRAVRNHLLGQPAAPNILAFGIGDADAATVGELATKPHFAFVAARGVDTGAAISEFLTSLTQSVISSGQALASGSAELQSEKPEGLTLAVDVVQTNHDRGLIARAHLSPWRARRPVTTQAIQRNTLGALTKIGQGGQGVVYRAPNVGTKYADSMVYKEYKSQTLAEVDFTPLAAMPVLVENSLTYAQAERLISIAA